MRLLLALATLALIALADPPGADAYRLGGEKWPGRTITYHADARGWGEAIRLAVRDWNSTGMQIRLRPAPRARAKLRIVAQRISGGALLGSAGEATLGWAPSGAITRRSFRGVQMGGDAPCGFPIRTRLGRGRIRCDRGPHVWLDRLPAKLPDDSMALLTRRIIVAHELGHVLGLRHAHRNCSVMSYRRETRCPKPPHPWQARCRVLEPDDVRGAIRRYGGRMRPPAPEFCDIAPPAPLAPGGVHGTFDPSARVVTLSWTAPAGPAVAGYGFAAAPDACPTAPAEQLPATTSHQYLAGSRSGRFCFAVWSLDRWGRSSPPATAWVDVPPVPDEESPPSEPEPRSGS